MSFVTATGSLCRVRRFAAAHKIDDGTGTIWIVTEDTVPNNGAEIGVSGTIGNGVTWKGKNYGLGMYEKDRRFRKR